MTDVCRRVSVGTYFFKFKEENSMKKIIKIIVVICGIVLGVLVMSYLIFTGGQLNA